MQRGMVIITEIARTTPAVIAREALTFPNLGEEFVFPQANEGAFTQSYVGNPSLISLLTKNKFA